MSTINVTNLKGRGGASPNLPDGANITGVATASGGFSGTLTGTGLTTGSDGSINVTSIRSVGVSTLGNVVITGAVGGGATVGAYAGVTTFYGDGSSLTGVGESVAPWNYNPAVNDSGVSVDTGIGITFNKKLYNGTGEMELKIVNAGAGGTSIQKWGISSITVNGTEFTSTLVSDLDVSQTYELTIPDGFLKDSTGSNYVGTAYTFAITAPERKVYSWGWNGQGNLGHNNEQKYSSPVQLPGTTWAENGLLGNGFNKGYHMGGVKTDGTLWMWGRGDNGILGVDSEVDYSSPVQVPGTTWTAGSLTNHEYGTLITKTDGTLWAWGYNAVGMLGMNDIVQYSSPVQIPGTSWKASSQSTAGGEVSHTAIRTDGTLWSWGQNQYGELGINNRTNYSSPVQIPGTTWSTITGSECKYMSIKTDGTLWSWGRNTNGELGQNTNATVSSPVQVPGTTWRKVTLGHGCGLGTKTDGTLWGWGDNTNGNLAQNNRTLYSSPVQIPGTTWTSVHSVNDTAQASKTDGTLWSWGKNDNGQMGINSEVYYSSPVQVMAGEVGWLQVVNFMDSAWRMHDDYTP